MQPPASAPPLLPAWRLVPGWEHTCRHKFVRMPRCFVCGRSPPPPTPPHPPCPAWSGRVGWWRWRAKTHDQERNTENEQTTTKMAKNAGWPREGERTHKHNQGIGRNRTHASTTAARTEDEKKKAVAPGWRVARLLLAGTRREEGERENERASERDRERERETERDSEREGERDRECEVEIERERE